MQWPMGRLPEKVHLLSVCDWNMGGSSTCTCFMLIIQFSYELNCVSLYFAFVFIPCRFQIQLLRANRNWFLSDNAFFQYLIFNTKLSGKTELIDYILVHVRAICSTNISIKDTSLPITIQCRNGGEELTVDSPLQSAAHLLAAYPSKFGFHRFMHARKYSSKVLETGKIILIRNERVQNFIQRQN